MTKTDKRILFLYYFTEAVLFLIIKAGEQIWHVPGEEDPGIPGSPLALIRYCAIACNFLMIVYLYLRHGRRFSLRENLIPLAFTLTLAADCFMCVIDNKRILGYLLFTLVETAYMLYLKPTWKGVTVRLILYAVMLLLLWIVKMLNADNIIAMANMAQLTVNLFCAWIQHAKTKNRETLLFAWGITLFAGCDYAILVRTLFQHTPSGPVYIVAAFIVWTCYIPAQVLLLRSYVEKIMSSERK